MFNHNFLLYSIILFTGINLIAFFIMLNDKFKAVNSGSKRISEGLMFFWATIGAAFGIYIGMFVFHHKTQKWYFLIGMPLLILENIATLYIIYLFLLSK